MLYICKPQNIVIHESTHSGKNQALFTNTKQTQARIQGKAYRAYAPPKIFKDRVLGDLSRLVLMSQLLTCLSLFSDLFLILQTLQLLGRSDL